MRILTSHWYEVKLRYEKLQENGTIKSETENYTVDALTFGEAEKKALEYIYQYTKEEVKVMAIKHADYAEIMFTNKETSDKYYKAKLCFIVPDERGSGKEKKCMVTYLVQGASMDDALKNVRESMKDSMQDYLECGITETNIADVVLHEH